MFPTGVVDGPENGGFVFRDEGLGPDAAIALVGRDVEAIDDGHAAGKFAFGFDFKEVIGLGGDEGRVQGDGHGDGIGQRNAVLAGLLEEGFLGKAVAFDGKCGDEIIEAEDVLDVGGIEHGVAAAEVPPDKFDRKTTAGDHARGFRIAPDVVLGGRRDVAFTARGATHDDAAADFGGDSGAFFQGESDVGQRSEGDQDETGVGLNDGDDGVGGVLAFRSARGRRITAIAEAVAAVEPVCAVMRAGEWFFGAGENGDGGIAELGGVQGVGGGLGYRDVAGDGGDGENVDVGIAESHDEGDGVV